MIKIYNTLTKGKEEFIPIEEKTVKMYVCGPTTYNYFHIGNGRAFLFFDVVRRYLSFRGYKVYYVQNLTDIDDKIIKKANEDNTTYEKVANTYIKAFKEDTKALGIKKASYHPKATEYVDEMIDFIVQLQKDGYAYTNGTDVYFAVRKVKDYGKLSGKNINQLLAGARVEENTDKGFAGDFVLWKQAKPGEPSWDSPWGKGRPGWHTECVVMGKDILGKIGVTIDENLPRLFDIHAGGVDLVFPHHENEIAQAEASMGCHLANYWMHNGFINIEGEKMSKSLGNFLTVRDILKHYDADTVRHFYLSKHYRSPIDFNEAILKESASAVKKIFQPIKDCFKETGELPGKSSKIKEYYDAFYDAMDDDFNTARALAVLFDIVKEINASQSDRKKRLVYTLFKLSQVLGFFNNKNIFKDNNNELSQELIELLISYREKYKREKNWVGADMIRDDLQELGIILQDTKEGTKWDYK